MTVAAIDAVISGVMFVAKLDRLLTLNPLSCVPGGAVQLGRCPKRRQQNEDRAKDTYFG